MKGICPNCEKETELTPISRCQEISVRGEAIPVNVHYFQCAECGEEFDDPRSPHDPLEEAYREYRTRHGMLQPEDIRGFRDRYGLSQRELSVLLGWGGATLSRYENGALQDEAHDKVLRLAMEPRNLLRLLETNPQAIDEAKRGRLIDQLRKQVYEENLPLSTIYQKRFGRYPADHLSGYRSLDLDKFYNAALFFCADGGVPKTKLNKLLFYADFKHFKHYVVSITGMRYARLPFGPVPDRYELYLAALHDEEEAIEIEETPYGAECVGEVLIARRKPDLSIFSTSELKILTTVKEHFQHFSASAISRFSHQERGYVETRNGELISYEHASSLQL